MVYSYIKKMTSFFNSIPNHTTKLTPNLIFAESHLDPITGKFLERLVPRLEGKYSLFYDETPKGWTFDDMRKEIQEAEIAANDYVSNMKEWGLDPEDLEGFRKYKSLLEYKYGLRGTAQALALADKICRLPALSSLGAFFDVAEKKDIKYQGIDFEIRKNYDYYISAEGVAERDILFATTYLSTMTPFFSRVGLEHVKGIQNEICKKQGLTKAQNQYRFFHLYSSAIPYEYSPEFQAQRKQNEFPLNLYHLNSDEYNEEEMVDIVLQRINLCENNLQELNNENVLGFGKPKFKQI